MDSTGTQPRMLCMCGSTRVREVMRQDGKVYIICPVCGQDDWIPEAEFDTISK